jgi:shikimate dehydrogenase
VSLAELPSVDGNTKLYLLVAHPSSHVRSPQAFNAFFAARGVNAVMVPADVPPAALPAFVEAVRGWENVAAIGVTIPHKEAIAALVDELHPSAATIGAVNSIRREPDGRLVGAMFDGIGFVEGLLSQGHAVAGRSVAVVGAGGAGRAIAFAMADAGVASLRLSNRSPRRAEELVDDVRAVHPSLDVVAAPIEDAVPSAGVVCNATSLGMHAGDPLPLPVDRLAPGTLVAEAIMMPPVTPLLEAAAARGLATHQGHHMRDAQVRRCADFAGLVPLDAEEVPA